MEDRKALLEYFKDTLQFDFINDYYEQLEKQAEIQPGAEQKEIVSSNINSLFSISNSNPLKDYCITNIKALTSLLRTTNLSQDKDVKDALKELAQAANISLANTVKNENESKQLKI